MSKPKKLKIKYVQAKADPEEIQRRLSRAYDVLFNEVDKLTIKHGLINK
jgi:hypothetical protein